MNKREVNKAHRTIDLQRPIVDGKKLYQVLCLCGEKTPAGSRASAEVAQKNHRLKVWFDTWTGP